MAHMINITGMFASSYAREENASDLFLNLEPRGSLLSKGA